MNPKLENELKKDGYIILDGPDYNNYHSKSHDGITGTVLAILIIIVIMMCCG